MFLRLPGLYVDVRKEDVSSAGHKTSVYFISKCARQKTRTLSDKILNGSLLLQSSFTRISQIIVAADFFRGSKEGEFHSVMVCCKESKESDYMQLWFAKIFFLVRVDHKR